MTKIRKDDRNREERRRAAKGFYANIYCKKYKSQRNRIRAIKLFRGIA